MKEIWAKDQLARLAIDMFARPALAMIAWGAFLHMSKVHLPSFGYWEFFMLNIVAMILTSTAPERWGVK